MKNTENSFQSLWESDWGLHLRAKGSKLTHEQIMFLWRKLHKEDISVSQLSKSFKLSPNTIHKIKRLTKSEALKITRREIKFVSTANRIKITRDICKFYELTNTPFTVLDIQNRLKANSNLNVSKDFVRKLMKNNCKLSYTRCKSKPNTIDLNKVKVSRCLFEIKFSQAIDSSTLIINVDESSINRKTKLNYAWSVKDNPKEYQNTPFRGSISLVLAILSNGAWYSMLTNSTINSILLEHYLNKLNKWMIKHQNFGYSKAVITLDNWSYHRSIEVMKKLRRMNVDIMYLSAYSPWLTPIEMAFSYVKLVLKRQTKGMSLDLNSKLRRDEVFKALKSLTSNIIIEYYDNLLKEIKTQLDEARSL